MKKKTNMKIASLNSMIQFLKRIEERKGLLNLIRILIMVANIEWESSNSMIEIGLRLRTWALEVAKHTEIALYSALNMKMSAQEEDNEVMLIIKENIPISISRFYITYQKWKQLEEKRDVKSSLMTRNRGNKKW